MNSLVVGIGAPTRGDDAIGIEVARAVSGLRLQGVDVIDDAEPIQLVDLVDGQRRVVVVDAMLTGVAPGEVAVFSGLPAPAFGPSSTHSFGVGQALELARVLGRLPRDLFLVGVEVAQARTGTDLSEPVRAAIPHAVAQVRQLLAAE